MAIATYISVTCAASPMSPDPSATPPPELPPSRRPTKIILPKKKPMKWSTGMAPGDYGGPPTTTKLRKYWGGEEPDPLTSDDYIWNKDFMGRFQRMINNPNDDSSPQSSTDKDQESSAGFLSFSRVMSLDSMEVDLSKELTKPSKAVSFEQLVQVPSQSSTSSSQKWRSAPTRREQEKWDRATKAATGGSEVLMREARQPRGDPEILAAQSREQYFKLKKKLQILTVGIGGVGLVSSYLSYTPEIAASYGAGFIGSLIYIRMLGSTVDSMADGARGLIKGAIGQPRLLVPVVLVMIYNRWNAILVPEYGILHLELIPMLVGFFTYKIATFFQAIEEGVNIISTKDQT